YDTKHNEANGEGNRDGSDDNRSWNCGTEGPTADADIVALRSRQKRALLTTLMLSFGVPLLLGGDEMGRTQQGNNNAYCQADATPMVDDDFLVMVNGWWEPVDFTIPVTRAECTWLPELDTFDPLATSRSARLGGGDGITVGPRSIVVLRGPTPRG